MAKSAPVLWQGQTGPTTTMKLYISSSQQFETCCTPGAGRGVTGGGGGARLVSTEQQSTHWDSKKGGEMTPAEYEEAGSDLNSVLQVFVESRLAAHHHPAEEHLLQVQLLLGGLTHLHYRSACRTNSHTELHQEAATAKGSHNEQLMQIQSCRLPGGAGGGGMLYLFRN